MIESIITFFLTKSFFDKVNVPVKKSPGLVLGPADLLTLDRNDKLHVRVSHKLLA